VDVAPTTSLALSPGLSQTLNAALIDPAFCAAFLASPVAAVRRAARAPGETFGTTLPDPALQLAAPVVTEVDLALLGCVAPPSSLAVAARELLRLCAESAWTDGARAPACYEGRLAGAA
jgi:hypothetical protein